jgi:AsmA protein
MRIGAALLAVALLIVLLGIAALVLFVDADVFRPRIERLVSQALGRSVSLGRLHWNLGRRIALRTEGGAVANLPEFEAPSLVMWHSIDFGLALWPLLRREVHIDHLSVQGLVVDLQRRSNGDANWVFAGASVTAGDNGVQPASGPGLKIALGSVALIDASLRFRDQSMGRDVALTALNLSLVLPEDLDAVQWQFRDVALSAEFQDRPLHLRAAVVRVLPAGPAVDLPAFDVGFDQISASGALQVTLGEPLSADARLNLAVPSLRDQMQHLGWPLPPMQDAKVPGPVNLDARIRFADGALRIDALMLHVDDTTLTGHVELPMLEPLALRFDLDADRLRADRYLAPSDTPSEPFALPVRELRAIDAQGVLRVGQLESMGAVVRQSVITVE